VGACGFGGGEGRAVHLGRHAQHQFADGGFVGSLAGFIARGNVVVYVAS
jgi:hypothetical protein